MSQGMCGCSTQHTKRSLIQEPNMSEPCPPPEGGVIGAKLLILLHHKEITSMLSSSHENRIPSMRKRCKQLFTFFFLICLLYDLHPEKNGHYDARIQLFSSKTFMAVVLQVVAVDVTFSIICHHEQTRSQHIFCNTEVSACLGLLKCFQHCCLNLHSLFHVNRAPSVM